MTTRAAAARRSSIAAVVLACAAGPAPATSPATSGGGAREAEVWAFTAPWDARSDSSLRVNGASLDVVVTGWIALDTAAGGARHLYDDPVARER
ncbi:MAG TPA: hypothetical protein VFZ11_15375, partial [Gemmatimonadaceae bacterium]